LGNKNWSQVALSHPYISEMDNKAQGYLVGFLWEKPNNKESIHLI
jgi:hypothetical protein